MKSTVITIKGDKDMEMIKLLSYHVFGVTSDTEIKLIQAIWATFSNSTFILNQPTKLSLITKIGGTEGNLKTSVSRLIKKRVLVKQSKLIGLNIAFKEVKETDQIVIRCH